MQPIESFTPPQLAEQAEAWREGIVGFAQALVRTPSLCGQEGDLAALLAAKLQELGYDEVYTDAIGNVIGRIKGEGTGPSVLFTTHLDHADPTTAGDWEVPPYEGRIENGQLLGAGACDHKAAIAAMAYGGAILKRLNTPLRGDYVFAAVVQSNAKASVGMRYLVDKTMHDRQLHCDLVVVGAPTNLNVNLGHRGRIELEIVTIGRTSHGGAPWLGLNAIYQMVPVLQEVQALATTLPSHPFLEKSTVAVTGIDSTPHAAYTVPDRCVISLDRRFLPSESVDDAVWQVQSIVNRLTAQDAEFKGEVRVRQTQQASYTGTPQTAPRLMHPLTTDSQHHLVKESVGALEALGQAPRFGKWTFTTDGGYMSTIKNIVTVGYAPGDENFAQTAYERVGVDALIQAAAGYAAISQRISG
jgi:putative selenium metabolism hydrolase